jgi:hypothetical protein
MTVYQLGFRVGDTELHLCSAGDVFPGHYVLVEEDQTLSSVKGSSIA